MPNELIDESKTLKEKVVNMVGGSKRISYEGIEFETWASKVALFFDAQSDSPVKTRIIGTYAVLSKENSKAFYDLAVGGLQAVK